VLGLKLVQRFSVVGAILMLLSFMLRWVVGEAPGDSTRTGPLAVMILGVALLLLSLFPDNKRLRNVLIVVTLLASIAALVVTLWSLMQTAYQVARWPDVRLGVGPVVALAGSMLFIMGSVAFIQRIATERSQNG
jgi:hypothetical protein